jgi:Txe/YoeB family toxin of Txe-Axe toxin-antitoxin module
MRVYLSLTKGRWGSRRFTAEHRLIYRTTGGSRIDQRMEIVAYRFHYED